MLIRRHDYRVEIAGNFPAAQYMSDLVSIDGIKIPTRRRVYLRDDNLMPMLDTLMVSIDLSGLSLRLSRCYRAAVSSSMSRAAFRSAVSNPSENRA